MFYFGHSQREKDRSFEFVKSFYPEKDFDFYLKYRNDEGSYICNYYEDNELKFTATYLSPRFNKPWFPFEDVFKNFSKADFTCNTKNALKKYVYIWNCGEIINLASTLKGHKFIDILEKFNESVISEQENFGAEMVYIQVNPRHQKFYERVLGARKSEDEKLNHMGLPAILMGFDTKFEPATTTRLTEKDFAII